MVCQQTVNNRSVQSSPSASQISKKAPAMSVRGQLLTTCFSPEERVSQLLNVGSEASVRTALDIISSNRNHFSTKVPQTADMLNSFVQGLYVHASGADAKLCGDVLRTCEHLKSGSGIEVARLVLGKFLGSEEAGYSGGHIKFAVSYIGKYGDSSDLVLLRELRGKKLDLPNHDDTHQLTRSDIKEAIKTIKVRAVGKFLAVIPYIDYAFAP